jgi:hypothetical protein
MTKEHPAVTMLREYDTLKSRLWQLEQELNRECVNYGKERGYSYFAPYHLRNVLRVAS